MKRSFFCLLSIIPALMHGMEPKPKSFIVKEGSQVYPVNQKIFDFVAQRGSPISWVTAKDLEKELADPGLTEPSQITIQTLLHQHYEESAFKIIDGRKPNWQTKALERLAKAEQFGISPESKRDRAFIYLAKPGTFREGLRLLKEYVFQLRSCDLVEKDFTFLKKTLGFIQQCIVDQQIHHDDNQILATLHRVAGKICELHLDTSKYKHDQNAKTCRQALGFYQEAIKYGQEDALFDCAMVAFKVHEFEKSLAYLRQFHDLPLFQHQSGVEKMKYWWLSAMNLFLEGKDGYAQLLAEHTIARILGMNSQSEAYANFFTYLDDHCIKVMQLSVETMMASQEQLADKAKELLYELGYLLTYSSDQKIRTTGIAGLRVAASRGHHDAMRLILSKNIWKNLSPEERIFAHDYIEQGDVGDLIDEVKQTMHHFACEGHLNEQILDLNLHYDDKKSFEENCTIIKGVLDEYLNAPAVLEHLNCNTIRSSFTPAVMSILRTFKSHPYVHILLTRLHWCLLSAPVTDQKVAEITYILEGHINAAYTLLEPQNSSNWPIWKLFFANIYEALCKKLADRNLGHIGLYFLPRVGLLGSDRVRAANGRSLVCDKQWNEDNFFRAYGASFSGDIIKHIGALWAKEFIRLKQGGPESKKRQEEWDKIQREHLQCCILPNRCHIDVEFIKKKAQEAHDSLLQKIRLDGQATLEGFDKREQLIYGVLEKTDQDQRSYRNLNIAQKLDTLTRLLKSNDPSQDQIIQSLIREVAEFEENPIFNTIQELNSFYKKSDAILELAGRYKQNTVPKTGDNELKQEKRSYNAKDIRAIHTLNERWQAVVTNFISNKQIDHKELEAIYLENEEKYSDQLCLMTDQQHLKLFAEFVRDSLKTKIVNKSFFYLGTILAYSSQGDISTIGKNAINDAAMAFQEAREFMVISRLFDDTEWRISRCFSAWQLYRDVLSDKDAIGKKFVCKKTLEDSAHQGCLYAQYCYTLLAFDAQLSTKGASSKELLPIFNNYLHKIPTKELLELDYVVYSSYFGANEYNTCLEVCALAQDDANIGLQLFLARMYIAHYYQAEIVSDELECINESELIMVERFLNNIITSKQLNNNHRELLGTLCLKFAFIVDGYFKLHNTDQQTREITVAQQTKFLKWLQKAREYGNTRSHFFYIFRLMNPQVVWEAVAAHEKKNTVTSVSDCRNLAKDLTHRLIAIYKSKNELGNAQALSEILEPQQTISLAELFEKLHL